MQGEEACGVFMLVICGEIDYNIQYHKIESHPEITGSAATNCYGVKGMAVRSKTDGLVHLLKRESMAKGVKVYYNEDGTVSIELHIIVENGVNLMAV